MTDRPNVLFIVTDQQRADHNGFMGNEVVRTPNLDRLAARGMVFDNAWVANPVCMPNRCSMLTGRMPTAHGVIFNDRSLDWGANTFARRLAGAGYRTALIGKSHLQHGMSRNAVAPYRGEGAGIDPHPAGWDEVEHFEHYLEGAPEDPDDFYGFEHIELAIDHGARVTGHHLHWALAHGGRREDLLVDYGVDAPAKRRSRNWWQIYEPPYAAELHSTTFVTQRSAAFIESAASGSAPWMAWCSFPDPHHPLTPPGPWHDRHVGAEMPLPSTRHDPLEGAPEHLRRFRAIHPRDQRDWVSPCGYGDDELLGEAIAATYGMIEMIDAGVGELLDQLDRLGIADRTIVVFTSDHGDMMGDHGLFLKGFMHYRGTLQVPLVVAAPGKAPGRSAALVSSVDLAPTVLELAAVDGYDGIQGASMASLLDAPAAPIREHVIVEDDIAPVIASLTPIPAKTRTLITPQFRYTRNTKGEDQLFDLSADPDETEDLSARGHPARAELIEQLADALIARDDAARGAPARGS